MAQVVDNSGNVAWTCTMTGPMTDPVMNNAVYYFADFSPFDNPGTYTISVPGLGTGDDGEVGAVPDRPRMRCWAR